MFECPYWAFFVFANIFLYDIITNAKAEKREYKTQDGGFRTNRLVVPSSCVIFAYI